MAITSANTPVCELLRTSGRRRIGGRDSCSTQRRRHLQTHEVLVSGTKAT